MQFVHVSGLLLPALRELTLPRKRYQCLENEQVKEDLGTRDLLSSVVMLEMTGVGDGTVLNQMPFHHA